MARYGTEGRGGGRRGYGGRGGGMGYDRGYHAGADRWRAWGEHGGGIPQGTRWGRGERMAPGRGTRYQARGYDRAFTGGSAAVGYGADYQSNRASSREHEYYNPGPTYGLRDSHFSRPGRNR